MEDFGMKENKSQDNKEPKGPYKHFERPTTSRSAMHHRHSEPAPEPTPSRPENNSKGTNHSQLWAGLIIVAIILIALIPIVSSKLHSSSNNLAEKSVKVSKSSSSKSHKHKSKKSKSSSSKKSKSKSSSKKEERKSSSQSQDVTPVVTSQSQSQSSESSQSSTQTYQSSTSQTTTQDQTQQGTQNYQTNQNTWQNNSTETEHRAPSSYTVQEGDSLSKIARENNTSVHHLEQLNGLESADSISIGQSIKLK